MKMHYCSGQTITEMLVVLFVISLGLYGAVTLAFSNVRLQEQDRDYIIAMNLGREALELAQNIRDSNWLAGRAFEDGLGVGTGDCTASVDGYGFWFNPAVIADAVIYRSEGFALQGVPSEDAERIPFNRLVTFSPICSDDFGDQIMPATCDCPFDHDQLVGVRTQVDLAWMRSGISRMLTVYSDLYDWR